MDPHDQELLDKQLRYLHVPPRRDGIVIATIVAVFLVGIIIGGALVNPHESSPSRRQPADCVGSHRRTVDLAAIGKS